MEMAMRNKIVRKITSDTLFELHLVIDQGNIESRVYLSDGQKGAQQKANDDTDSQSENKESHGM